MATGPVGGNPYLQQILQQNISSTTINPDQLKSSAKLLSSAMSAKAGIATISSAGSKINNVSQAIRNGGDLQAYEGFQTAMSAAGSSGEPLRMLRLANSAAFVAKESPEELVKSFSTLAQSTTPSNQAALVSKFTSSFSATVEKTGVEGLLAFNSAFNAVNTADYSGAKVSSEQNTMQLFRAVDSALSGKDEATGLSNLKRLARGVELSDRGDSIWNFFNDFIGLDPEKSMI